MSTPPPPPRRRTPSPAPAPTPAPSPPPPDLGARAARRADAQRGRRRRPSPLLIGALVVTVALVVVGVVVAGGGGGSDKPELQASTSVKLDPGELTVESVNAFKSTAESFPTDVSDASFALVNQYVHDATVQPLRTGKAKNAALTKIFDDAAIARLAGDDRGIVLDEGLPKSVGKVKVTGAPVALTALMDNDGKIILVTATIDLDVQARAARGTDTIKRTGTLVLSPQLDSTWKITAWTLHVERDGPGVTPTTTSSTVPTSTTVAP